MDNLTATRSLCNAICNTFYPDVQTIEVALFNEGIDPKANATPKDPQIFRVAVGLIHGYVEASRSEGGVSIGVRGEEAIQNSITFWCGIWGLDAEDELSDWKKTVYNGSGLW